MTRFLAVLSLCLALIAGTIPAMGQGTIIPRTCAQSIFVTQGAAGTSGLVGPNATVPSSMPTGGNAAARLTSGNGIVICGYTIQGGASSTAGLEYGTKTTNPCDTGTVPLTPAWTFGTGGGLLTDNADYFRGLAVPPGNTLCIVSTTAPASVIVYYDNTTR